MPLTIIHKDIPRALPLAAHVVIHNVPEMTSFRKGNNKVHVATLLPVALS